MNHWFGIAEDPEYQALDEQSKMQVLRGWYRDTIVPDLEYQELPMEQKGKVMGGMMKEAGLMPDTVQPSTGQVLWDTAKETVEIPIGLSEAALTLGQALIAAPVSGIISLRSILGEVVDATVTGNEFKASKLLDEFRENFEKLMPFQPKTSFGKTTTEVLASPFTLILEGIDWAAEFVTNDPQKQDAIRLLSETALMLAPLKALKGKKVGVKLSPKEKAQIKPTQKIADVPIKETQKPLEERIAILERAGFKEEAKKLAEKEKFVLEPETIKEPPKPKTKTGELFPIERRIPEGKLRTEVPQKEGFEMADEIARIEGEKAQLKLPTKRKVTFNPEEHSAFDFVRNEGGINDPAMMGEARRLGRKEAGFNVLNKKTGMTFDKAREVLEAEGFLPEGSTVREVIDLLEQDLRAKANKTTGRAWSVKKQDLFEAEEFYKHYGSGAGVQADVGGYARTVKHLSAIDMPEIVSLTKDIMGGKYPVIKERLRALSGRALGAFYQKGAGKIELRADIFKDINTAKKVLAHEVGHLIDYIPDRLKSRGNILGHIASVKGYFKSLLEEYPGAPGKVLTAKDRVKLRREAEKLAGKIGEGFKAREGVTPDDILAVWRNVQAREKDPGLYEYIARLSTKEKVDIVKQAMKGNKPEWFSFQRREYNTATADIRALYQKLLKEEIIKRRLIEKQAILNELKELTQVWKPFNELIDPNYTKYRYSNKELYADALSVFINDPALLKQTAPTFRKAFLNYMEINPEFKESYERVQGLIKDNEVLVQREKDLDVMFRRGEEKLKEMAEQEPLDIFNTLKKELVDNNAPLIKRVKEAKKAGKIIRPEDNPVFWVEELPYLSSEVYQHLRDVNNGLLKPARELGITTEDIGKYMLLRRIAKERTKIANPLGHTPETAIQQLEFMKKRLGDEKYGKVKEFAETYNRIRQENVISVIERAEVFDQKTTELLKDNEFYATFDVQAYLEKRYGRNISKQIYKQIGTFQEVTNPFAATLMKDKALLFSANTKMIKQKTVNFLATEYPTDISPAETRWNGKYHAPIEPKDPKLGTINYLHKGEVQSYYVPKSIAESFSRNPYEVGRVVRGLELITAPLKEIFVGKNPFWTMWNIQRDVKAWAKQLPGGSIPKAVKYILKSFPDTYIDVFKGISSKDVADMYKNKMLVIDRHFRAIEKSPETQIDRMIHNYALSESRQINLAARPFVWLYNALDKPGRFSERIVKIAGYKYLKAKGLPPKEVEHIVRSRAGSPDFLRGGVHRRAANSLYLFSNAGIQGIRGAIESAREMPSAYAYKTFKYDIAPKLLMYAAGIGALGKGVKAVMDRIPDRDKENYITIPLGLTDNDKAIYFVMPHDFQGQIIGGLLWDSLNARKPEDASAFLDYMGGGMPYSSLNPIIGESIKWWQYATNKNPYNSWSGRYVIPENVFKVGGERALRFMLRDSWNNMGGSVVYRFKYDTGDQNKGELEKILETPLAGSFTRRFLRVSDWGLREELREPIKDIRKRKAKENLDFKDVLFKVVDGEVLTKEEAIIFGINQDKLVTKQGKPTQFFINIIGKRQGNAFIAEYLDAQNEEERTAVIMKWIELQDG